MGYVDPVGLNFQKEVICKINQVVEEKVDTYSNEVLSDYQKIYQEHPFLRSPETLASIKKMLSKDTLKRTFDL